MHSIRNKSTLRILAKLTYFIKAFSTSNDLIQRLQQFSCWKNTAVLNNWFKMLTSDWSMMYSSYQKYFWNQYAAITQRKITWTWPQYFFTEIQFRNSSCFSKFFRVINSLPEVKSFLELKFTSSVSTCVTRPSTEPWLRIWFVKLADLEWRHSQVRAVF